MNRSVLRRSLALTALFLGGLTCLQGQNIASVVHGSSRSNNGLILTILTGPSLTKATEAAKALGERSDPFVSDILEGLFSRLSGPKSYRFGLLFREVLDYVFLLPRPAPAKIRANESELSRLLARLQTIGDGATKQALLETTIYLPRSASGKALLDEGVFLAGYLRATKGVFSPGRLDEALGYLRACRAHSNEVLRSQVVGLIELSRNGDFVRAARAYLSGSK